MAGGWEEGFFRRLDWREGDDLRKAASRYDLLNKKPGAKRGPIGPVGLRILQELIERARAFRGRLFPTTAEIARWSGVCRATACRYLKRLADAGILEWVRRIVPKDDRWERGPQVEQTSNAYRLALPEKLRRLIRRPPKPIDDEARRAEVLARIRDHIRTEAAAELDAMPNVARALRQGPGRRPEERE